MATNKPDFEAKLVRASEILDELAALRGKCGEGSRGPAGGVKAAGEVG